MDLAERRRGALARHPWETARVLALAEIIRRLQLTRPRVLDVGCGDGYVIRELVRRLELGEVVAHDIHLDDALIRELSQPGLTFVRELPSTYRAELVSMLDVLEHVADPAALLAEVVRERLAPGGHVIVTVPAFQRLMTRHDRSLKHFRRYSRPLLLRQVIAAGLEPVDSGYLFASLLAPRALSAVWDRLRGGGDDDEYQGIGGWRGSERLTRLTHRLLTLDNRFCLAAHDHGVDVPGLSIWLTCRISQ